MNKNHQDSFDPYEEMSAFYREDDPTEEQQFRFVEAMKQLIDSAYLEDDIIAFSYNLAIYYRDIREFELEKKYLELGAQHGSPFHEEELGFLYYYGLTGERNFKKAYQYFSKCESRRSQYMLADMYHDGAGVPEDAMKAWDILAELMEDLESEKDDPAFASSTLFPEVALRHVRLCLEADIEDDGDWNDLVDARFILAVRQQRRPFWGNIKTMRDILDAMMIMRDRDYGFIDLYDLLTFYEKNAVINFDFGDSTYQLEIFPHEGEIVYQLEDRWYHGAEDFLGKARVGGKRITTIMDKIQNINRI